MPIICSICKASFRDSFNLRRHQRCHTENLMASKRQIEDDFVESDHDDDDNDSENESTKSETNDSDSSHEDSSLDETDNTSDTDSDDEHTIKNNDCEFFQDLLEKSLSKYEDKRQEIIDEEINNGYNSKQASKRAYKILLPKYRKTLRHEYQDMLCKLHALRKEPIHKSIMRTAKKLKEEDEYDSIEALQAAVSKRKHLVGKLFPNDISDYSESEDDEMN